MLLLRFAGCLKSLVLKGSHTCQELVAHLVGLLQPERPKAWHFSCRSGHPLSGWKSTRSHWGSFATPKTGSNAFFAVTFKLVRVTEVRLTCVVQLAL